MQEQSLTNGISTISRTSWNIVLPTSSLEVAYPHSKDMYMTALTQAKPTGILPQHANSSINYHNFEEQEWCQNGDWENMIAHHTTTGGLAYSRITICKVDIGEESWQGDKKKTATWEQCSEALKHRIQTTKGNKAMNMLIRFCYWMSCPVKHSTSITEKNKDKHCRKHSGGWIQSHKIDILQTNCIWTGSQMQEMWSSI